MPGPREGDEHGFRNVAFDPDLIMYIVITTASLTRAGAVAHALQDLVDSSQIQILDLVGVQIDDVGGFAAVEPELLTGFDELPTVDGDTGGVLSADDIAMACSGMSPGTCALILVIEDGWARSLARAVRESGGRIVGGERIPRDRIEQSWRSRR